MDNRGGTSRYSVDPLEAFEETLQWAWKAICREYDVLADLPDFQSLFQGVKTYDARQAAKAVIVNMLSEITQLIDRFSPWYTRPARAFGLTSFRSRQTRCTTWYLAPEAIEKWCPQLDQLSAEFDHKSGLIEAMILIDELGLPEPSAEDSVLATCNCQPPRELIVKMAFLQGDGITCYNVVGDIRGREIPEEIVLVAGHLDSWDVGTGAMDDGAGVVLALASARLLLKQDLRPRRTVRVVHFTAEEYGAPGGKAYLEAHRSELDRHVLAIESDSGAYAPRGFSIDADSLVVADLALVSAPLARVAPEEWSVSPGGSGADIGAIVREGVPGVGHRVEHSHYFDVHHSRADTFEKVDPDLLARNVAAIAGLIYTVAESPARPGSIAAGPISSGGH